MSSDIPNTNSFLYPNDSEVPKNEPETNDVHLGPAPHADTYRMDHGKRGVAIIFNQVNFSASESRRNGSDKDRDDLTSLFHDLSFDVLEYNDLAADEVSETLLKASQMDHSDSDCLVIVVMSHGGEGQLWATDKTYPTKTLWKNFDAISCPTLGGKPKL